VVSHWNNHKWKGQQAVYPCSRAEPIFISNSLSNFTCSPCINRLWYHVFPVQNWNKSVFKLLRNCPEQYSELAAEPLPVFFEGIMTSDFLQDLICSCKGKVMRGRSCVCNKQNMCCTELCPCQDSDFCMNFFSRSRENDRFWRRRGKRCRLVEFSLSPFPLMK
jgi:hypothetical protein